MIQEKDIQKSLHLIQRRSKETRISSGPSARLRKCGDKSFSMKKPSFVKCLRMFNATSTARNRRLQKRLQAREKTLISAPSSKASPSPSRTTRNLLSQAARTNKRRPNTRRSQMRENGRLLSAGSQKNSKAG